MPLVVFPIMASLADWTNALSRNASSSAFAPSSLLGLQFCHAAFKMIVLKIARVLH